MLLITLTSLLSTGLIDRRKVLGRHEPGVTTIVPGAVFAVGNGQLAFSPDVTGFQSLNASYSRFPLTTLTDWMWHSSPFPEGVGSPFAAFKQTRLMSSGRRPVPYPLLQGNNPTVTDWLRSNPHRLDVGQVALRRLERGGAVRPLAPADITAISQRLELWTGSLHSSFALATEEGARGDGDDAAASGSSEVNVTTTAHPDIDAVGWRLSLGPAASGRLAVRLAFPYGSTAFQGAGAEWASGSNHSAAVTASGEGSIRLRRIVDFDEYDVRCDAKAAGTALGDFERDGPHAFTLALPAQARELELTCVFAPPAGLYPLRDASPWQAAKSSATAAALTGGIALASLRAASDAAWESFWRSGAFVDLAGGGGHDGRALELERRVVLSQYLTRIHSAGAM